MANGHRKCSARSAAPRILAGEVVADTTLADALKDRVPQVHAIGDCTGLGLIRKAVEEGARAARAL